MRQQHTLLSWLLAGSLMMGCGSGSGVANNNFASAGVAIGTEAAPPVGRTITIVESKLQSRDGDTVDSIDVEGVDASGQVVFGPLVIPASLEMKIPGVPPEVKYLQLDYLRNHGFMLFRAEVPVGAEDTIKDPDEKPLPYQHSALRVVPDGAGGFSLLESISGPDPSPGGASPKEDVRAQATEKKMLIKGVCYSPAPINFSNKAAPAVGDLFWDPFKVGPADTIYGWQALFLNFFDENIGQSRADLEKIRGLGANTVRLYSCINLHLNQGGTNPFPDPATAQHFIHKEFLDACWADGEAKRKPLNVIVDIPMPDSCFNLHLQGRLIQEANDALPVGQRRPQSVIDAEVAAEKQRRLKEIAWWEANLEQTVLELKDYPAVIGFNIMNEQDGPRPSHPNQGLGPDNDETQFFYSQSKKYADKIKSIDNTKLVGWGFHDSPDLVIFASQFPTVGPKYMEQLTSFDYWGINSYQSKSLDSLTGPGFRGSYADLPASMKKPILLTELGWPSTGHDAQDKIYEDASTRAATAKVVTKLYDLVFTNPLYLGACYFEFSDEWWKQAGGKDYTWDGGPASGGFPNGYGDEEGFGLYAVKRQGGRANDDFPFVTFGPDPDPSLPYGSKGPKNPYDALVPRNEVIKALSDIYKKY